MSKADEHSCCPDEPAPDQPPRKRGLGAWATGGSLLSAVLASACCWLPLVAVAFGASAAGAGAFFEQYRPHFLTVAVVLLGAGFYSLYIRKVECEPDSACAVPNQKAQRFSRGMFWVAVLFIGAFAFFPNYVGLLLGGSTSGNPVVSENQVQVTFAVEGMTCEACAAGIHAELVKVPGVTSANVLYDQKSATAILEQGAKTTDEDLLMAITNAGYSATPQSRAPGGGR